MGAFCGSYPSRVSTHDATFRDRSLNESDNNSYMDLSNRSWKRVNFDSPENKKKETWLTYNDYGTNQGELEMSTNNNATLKPTAEVHPIIQIFYLKERGDKSKIHMLACVKELLDSENISTSDICNSEFLGKISEILSNSGIYDEEMIFIILTIFEKHMLPKSSTDELKLISEMCREKLGKLALKSNEELSSAAEKCLNLLGRE